MMVDKVDSIEAGEQKVEEVVREATTKTRWAYLKAKGGSFGDYVNRLTMTELFEAATSGYCTYMSISVVHELAENNPDKFEKMAILTTYDIPESSPIYYNIDPGAYHTYFLLLGTDRNWYAGSPANHNMKIAEDESVPGGFVKDSSYATTLFQNHSLKNVLAKIEERDRCSFPSAEDIMNEFKHYDYSFRIDKDVIEVVQIKKAEDEVFSTMKRSRF